jgi:hypothetical protein
MEADHGNHLVSMNALRREVAEGFLDSHARANRNAAKALEIGSFCYALIEMLEEKGLINYEELNERKKAVNKRLVKKFADQGLGVIALQDFKEDKYRYSDQVQIDCASRVSICRAACCRLDLALSRQDLEEGIIKWDLGRPYLIARNSDDYCRHLDRYTCRCAVWQHRPIPCRGYDCRRGERIWLDFENSIINHDFDKLMQQRDGMAI